MALGLLTVFIPLYVVVFQNTSILGGPLLALGVMTSIAVFCSIPASFLWGYLCDKSHHYKKFILLSFASIAIILFLMTMPFAQNLIVFVILYVIMQILHVAHESPKNVLMTEHYSRKDWEKSFGFYEGLTEIGFIIGLAAGMVIFASSLSFSVLSTYAFYLCCIMSVVAFVLAVALIADPLMVFERRLVGIEKKIDYTCRGIEGSSKLMDGLRWNGSLKQDSFVGFAFAIVLFALASSLFFTPLPIYLKDIFGGQQQYVYLAYILNSTGATAGYSPNLQKSIKHKHQKTNAPLHSSKKSACVRVSWHCLVHCCSKYVDLWSFGLFGLFLLDVLYFDAFAFNGNYT
jgi:MFS family permease